MWERLFFAFDFDHLLKQEVCETPWYFSGPIAINLQPFFVSSWWGLNVRSDPL